MPQMTFLLPMMMLTPLIALTLSHKKFLMCLLNLEAMVLGLIVFSFMSTLHPSWTESLSTLLILSMGACEASLGLACLVNMMRTYGNDNIKSINTIKY